MLLTFIGSVLGSWLLLQIDSSQLVLVLPFLLMAMGVYVLVSPSINDQDKKTETIQTLFHALSVPMLGVL